MQSQLNKVSSLINSLQARQFEPGTRQSFKKGASYLVRKQLYSRLIPKLQIENKNLNKQETQIINKYFDVEPNDQYKVLRQLPIKVFVCGYCKKVNFDLINWIMHCIQYDCPINHQRSTYSIKFKGGLNDQQKEYGDQNQQKSQLKSITAKNSAQNRSNLIQNDDIQRILTRQQYKKLQNRYKYSSMHTGANYYTEFKTIYKNKKNGKNSNQQQQDNYSCGKCNYKCIGKHNLSQLHFINHCFKCNSTKHQNTSHYIKALQFQQSDIQFIQDIRNFLVNYNILYFTPKNKFVHIQSNNDYYLDYGYYCQNCNIQFQQQSQFIIHGLFLCKDYPHHGSSHLLKVINLEYSNNNQKRKSSRNQIKYQSNLQINTRQITNETIKYDQPDKYIQMNKNQDNQQKLENIQQHKQIKRPRNRNKRNVKQQRINIIQEINPKYQSIKDKLENTYICGSCLQMFQDNYMYLTHNYIFNCPLNNQNDTHFFYHENKEQIIIEQIKQHLRKQIKVFQLRQNYFLFNRYKLQRIYDLKQNPLIKNSQKISKNKKKNKNKVMKCGKCNMQFEKPGRFILHLLRICNDLTNQKHSHHLILNQQAFDKNYVQYCIQSMIYGQQLIGNNPNIIYNLQKNTKNAKKKNKNEMVKFSLDNKYTCGKCSIAFNNQFHFIYHSLFQCDSINHQKSSHFINSIITDDQLSLYQIISLPYGHPFSDCQNRFRIFKYVLKNYKIPLRYLSDKSSQFSQSQSNFSQSNRSPTNPSLNDQINSNHTIQQADSQNDSQSSSNQLSIIDGLNDQQIIQKQNPPNLNYQDAQLYPNSSYKLYAQKKIYCAPCDKTFKRYEDMSYHLIQCGNLCNFNSSHLFISKNQFNQIVSQSCFNLQNIRQKCKESYPSYKEDSRHIVCGCGKSAEYGLTHHLAVCHGWKYPKNTSHIVIRIHLVKNQDVSIYLPVKPNTNHLNDEFICPCNPFKKFLYMDFINHILIRHDGKSPIFCMQKPE